MTNDPPDPGSGPWDDSPAEPPGRPPPLPPGYQPPPGYPPPPPPPAPYGGGVPSPTVPPPPAYPPPSSPGYPPAPGVAPQTNGLAVASLVLGCVGIACCVAWILALVFGYMARSQIDQSWGRQTGRGLATAGIILGWVWCGLTIVYLILVAATS